MYRNMKLRMFVAIISTIGLFLIAFLFPAFWISYKEYFNIDSEAEVLIVPGLGSVVFFLGSAVVVIYLWARSFDSNMK